MSNERSDQVPSARTDDDGGGNRSWSQSSAIRQVFVLGSSIVIAVIVLFTLITFARPIAILLASIIIAVAVSPLVDYLKRWLPHAVAVIGVYVLLVILGLALLGTVGLSVATEVREAVDAAPRDREELVNFLTEHVPFSREQVDEAVPRERPAVTDSLPSIIQLAITTLLEVVIAFFLSLYWLLAAPPLRGVFLSLFPNGARRERASDIVAGIGHKMGGYIRALTIDAIAIGLVTYVALLLFGLPLASPLALLQAIGVFVPVVGPLVAAIPAILIAFTISPLTGVAVLAFYIILQQIESNIFLPNIMGRQAEIHPLIVVFAIFAGGSVANILGALIAVPLAGALQVIASEVIIPMIRKHVNAAEARSDKATDA